MGLLVFYGGIVQLADGVLGACSSGLYGVAGGGARIGHRCRARGGGQLWIVGCRLGAGGRPRCCIRESSRLTALPRRAHAEL